MPVPGNTSTSTSAFRRPRRRPSACHDDHGSPGARETSLSSPLTATTGQSGKPLTLVLNERSVTVLPADTVWHEHSPLRRAAPGMHLRGALRGPFACRFGPVGLGVAVSRLRAAAGLSPLTAGGDDALREPGMRASLLGAARRGALRARPVQQLQPLARLQRRQPRPRPARAVAVAPRARLHVP
jgi:hypothetical protein